MSNIIISPTYFPDIISFAAMVQAESITFEISENYQKQSYRTRMYIATSNGLLLLNIPILHNKGKGRKKIEDTLIENSFLWQRQHWRSLVIAYRTSPFFEFYEDDIYPLFHKEHNSLLAFNLETIKCLMGLLDLDFSISYTEEYKESYAHKIDLRFFANGKRKNKIDLPQYRQVFEEKNGFIPYLTVLDLLFNLGPEALTYLQKLDLKL
ncbi:WbqC family protein [Leeuwenhoekiella sp. MAR_2009_132]|uniref:WbqC family protein n=1 Tax=Leeuwenhoekiella sp. MAR_2009_132 TaxID=1392489 RepID=UPI00048AC411|nr:WbqC family protein [Leeuwenhoekiella sp. MAR_2009_132]